MPVSMLDLRPNVLTFAYWRCQSRKTERVSAGIETKEICRLENRKIGRKTERDRQS